MIDIFNNLSVLGKSLFIILIIMFFVLIGLIIYLCIKNKEEKETNIDMDFFDDLKKEDTNSKSVFVDNVDIDKVNEVAKKIEIEKESPSSIPSVTYEERKETNEKFDIANAAKQIEEDIESSNIDLTEYEVEQEEKAIISYTELLNKVKQNAIANKVNVQTVELEPKKEEIKEDFDYDTEILDFSDLSDTPAPKETTTTLFKQDDIKEMLNIKNVDTNLYSSDEFLKALKELRDSLD